MRTTRLAIVTALCFMAGLALTSGVSAQPGRITVGQPLPDLRLPTVERDATVALSQFRGKRLLLIEFASW